MEQSVVPEAGVSPRRALQAPIPESRAPAGRDTRCCQRSRVRVLFDRTRTGTISLLRPEDGKRR